MSSEKLLQTITQEKATLKIITKTKNERFFIEKWIKHHLAIIGDGKLIIFDNMSDDQHVLDVYKKYKEHILLIKFDFHFNDIHHYIYLKDFYDAIGQSCDFFTLLDTDEFLYFYDDNNIAIHDTSILDYLEKNKNCDFFAPCWLDNIKGEENTINLPPTFYNSLNHGKAIVHTKIFQNPNVDLCHHLIFRHTDELPYWQYTTAKIHFFIAHLKNLDIQQRITSNMEKLVSFGALKDNEDTETLFKLTRGSVETLHIYDYIEATKKLLHLKETHGDYVSDTLTKTNTITIEKNNTITFSKNSSQKVFQALMNRNYLDIIDYDASAAAQSKYLRLRDWIER